MSRPASLRLKERPFAAVRQAMGLPLHRAAARLGVHPRYLRSLELGRVPLSPLLAADGRGLRGDNFTTDTSRLSRRPGEGRPVSGNAGRPG